MLQKITKRGFFLFLFFCLFLFCCGIFVPRPEIEAALTAVDVQSTDHCTARGSPRWGLFLSKPSTLRHGPAALRQALLARLADEGSGSQPVSWTRTWDLCALTDLAHSKWQS